MLAQLARSSWLLFAISTVTIIMAHGSAVAEKMNVSNSNSLVHNYSVRNVQTDHSRLVKHSKKKKHHHQSHHHKATIKKAKVEANVAPTLSVKNRSKKLVNLNYTPVGKAVVSAASDGYVSASGSKTTLSMASLTSACGPPKAISSITQSAGPNGSQDFLNCGINGGGWEPAPVKMGMIKTVTLESEPAKSTFAPCQKFNSIFEKYGQKYNIPPIFLAAFAMQESSCDPSCKGDNGGAWGLMQITSDKCGGAPGGDCSNPDYNIAMGAKTFADGLSASGGNVLLALGAYNGWSKGLTHGQAVAAKQTGCCVCQQNLDYLQQFLNGWVLGVDPYQKNLGMVHNLDSCADQS
ncbi:family 23 glycoside hydrolase [Melampsora larici-populina 98AG31]|uniref:Family 23 glycoside hydrolase n=1 Tax=Melampsora larici-populina (strain 98AG31 / pathotype 3-4-7) TaxID=747676 RepID=F4S5A9_MELLP|nr:family 23 glycoside hydrolase [Melampsora larici-populina 98AG31]EGG00134.1 family 23 glycoside hydrolase [Melampsora larici-populina 98AG31]